MWVGKRLFDIFFSSIGLLILAPIFFAVAIWIKLDSEGPIFFRQKRVGRKEVPFFIHKFRTMYTKSESKGLSITVGNDVRITKSGAILRKFKIDELPQLIDVLLGTMSLVGPRPEVPSYVEHYTQQQRAKIFQMRPGITDWASVKFKNESEILSKSSDPHKAYIEEILPIKISYYEKYADDSSLLVDLKIIFLTIFEVYYKE